MIPKPKISHPPAKTSLSSLYQTDEFKVSSSPHAKSIDCATATDRSVSISDSYYAVDGVGLDLGGGREGGMGRGMTCWKVCGDNFDRGRSYGLSLLD